VTHFPGCVELTFHSVAEAVWAVAECNHKFHGSKRIFLTFGHGKPHHIATPLPAGWESMWDTKQVKLYYIHRQDGISQWDPPAGVAATTDGARDRPRSGEGGKRKSPVLGFREKRASESGERAREARNSSPDGLPHPAEKVSLKSPPSPKKPQPPPERPDEHSCPITLEVMTMPMMMVPCGCNGEKAGVEMWYKTKLAEQRKRDKDDDGDVVVVDDVDEPPAKPATVLTALLKCLEEPSCFYCRQPVTSVVENKAVRRMIEKWET